MKEIIWSEFQKAIFKEIHSGSGNLLINARAGSAKTSTLLASLKYIQSDKKTLVVAFNKRVADEFKEKAGDYPNLTISTLHSFGFRMVREALGKVKLDTEKTFKIIQKLLAPLKGNHKDKDDYNTIFEMKKCVSLCKSFLLDSPDKIDWLMDEFDISPGSLERDEFIRITIVALGKCKKRKDTVDWDDMLWLVFCLNLPIEQYDLVFIDETQDLNPIQLYIATKACKKDGRIIMVGDNFQCVDGNTLLETENGKYKKVKNIEIGEKILSWRIGKPVYRSILAKSLSDWKSGLKITTKSGKSLTMSPNHKIWAHPFELNGQHIVYLMYRSDLGFRVGKTNKWKADQNPLGNRARSEFADKMWILDVVATDSEARFLEDSYSLKFAIPTMVFNAKGRGLDEVRAKKLFDAFGQNGYKLLEYKNHEFDYPHWHQRTCSTAFKSRTLINVLAHSFKESKPNKSGGTYLRGGTTVNLEFSDKTTKSLVDALKITYKTYIGSSAGNTHHSLRKQFSSYDAAIKFARILADKTHSCISEKLFMNTGRDRDEFKLITASALHVGMKITSISESVLISDEIISIENVNGSFFDLSIEDTQNFFGNQILSHNSIYQFRGVEDDSMLKMEERLSAKTLSLPISYRCPKKVIFEAQKYVPDIKYAPEAKDGNVINIQEKEIAHFVKPNDIIISRTNAPLVKICFELWKNNIPASIKGKDLGPALLGLIAQSKKKSVPAFLTWLHKWGTDEITRLKGKNRNPSSITDKVECLVFLSDGKEKISELIDTVKSLFENKDNEGIVSLGTIHWFKGGESNRVFFLTRTMIFGETKEELNCWYVAITRAKETLFYVR